MTGCLFLDLLSMLSLNPAFTGAAYRGYYRHLDTMLARLNQGRLRTARLQESRRPHPVAWRTQALSTLCLLRHPESLTLTLTRPDSLRPEAASSAQAIPAACFAQGIMPAWTFRHPSGMRRKFGRRSYQCHHPEIQYSTSSHLVAPERLETALLRGCEG